MADAPIRVLIVEDHAVVRAGLRLLLETAGDIECVGEAGNAVEGIGRSGDLQPDVILLDLSMPGRTGIDALPELQEAAPQSIVLVLSMQDDPVYVREAFVRGARGYVLKEASDEELVGAIREVVAGGEYVSASLGARLAAAQRKEEREGLTDREREVLRLIALGHTNQEIATRLFVSVRTAEAHRAHIMNKLRLQTRAQLVRYALESGTVRKDDLD